MEKKQCTTLKAKLHIETSEMSKDNIKELLLTRMQILLRWMILLLTENCEIARYAPSSSATIQKIMKAVSIISDLESRYKN
jgi:hypothetical protein